MVATVGSISIDLSTNASQFETNFRSAATTVEAQSARMATSIAAVEEKTALASDRFKEFGVGLAAGTGLAAVFSLEAAFDKLKETVTQYAEITNKAKTAGLGTDTFQALSFAARQAEIDQETLNSSLDIFAKNSGLAEHGTGALYASLKKLNPELLQNIINTKDQEQRLKLAADAMARTTDASQKAALSAVLFGKGGVEMGRLLDQGRASIDNFKKSALALGVIVPDDFLKRGKEIAEELNTLGTIINVNIGEALINAAPTLERITTDFANLSKEINADSKVMTDFANNPSLAKAIDLLSQISGISIRPDSTLDNLRKGFTLNSGDVAALTSSLDFMEKKLSELRSQAAQGMDVHVEIGEAVQSIDELKAKLGEVAEVVGPIAKSISGQFAQAFREAENASMDALAKMSAAATSALPAVIRYGGDPSKIELPQFNSVPNANDSGVTVTGYGGTEPSLGGGGAQQNVNNSGVNVRSYGAPDPNAKATAGNTQKTAANVSSLDANTKSYLQSLSSDIGGYSKQQTIAISQFSQVVGASMQKLDSYALAALVHNNDSGATGTGNTMFGNAFDPSVGSYISSWGIGKTTRPGVNFPSTASDGTSNTSINVQQPGNPITFNYNAAPGVSNETAKQQALDMYYAMTTAASRA